MLVGGATAFASAFQLDVIGATGNSNLSFTVGDDEQSAVSDELGFVVNGQIEIYPDLLMIGRFYKTNATRAKYGDADEESSPIKLEGDAQISSTLYLGGAKYRVLMEEEMSVYLGGGYAQVSQTNIRLRDGIKEELSFTGNGPFGLAGISFQLSPEVVVRGDVALAPWAKYSVDHDTTSYSEVSGSILSGGGSFVYSLNDVFAVEIGFARLTSKINKAGDENGLKRSKVFSTVYGIGAVASF